MPTDLPLTIPVRDIVISALRELRDNDGLDRDESYLLARLERGEALFLRPATDRERAAVELLRRIYERDAGHMLADDSMFVEWMDDEIMAFIRRYGAFADQLREGVE